jgi:hypothetical protein
MHASPYAMGNNIYLGPYGAKALTHQAFEEHARALLTLLLVIWTKGKEESLIPNNSQTCKPAV